jgi:type IV pilus assembly protein PilE
MYMPMKRTIAGVTLVELMVAIAVLAIIASVGYPMYALQLQKARRADARSAVMELAMAQEREFAVFGHYSEPSAPRPAGITVGGAGSAPGVGSVLNADIERIAGQYGAFYSFNVATNLAGDTFTITATPTGGQRDDTDCASFSIDQTGAKVATDTDLCW